MKKYILLLLIVVAFSACENTWSSENRELFHQACIEEEMEDGVTEARAKAICDCRTDKIIEKYPNFSDAMENILDVVNDSELKDCMDEVE